MALFVGIAVGIAALVLDAPTGEGANVSIALYGRFLPPGRGWSTSAGAETDPGPNVTVDLGDRITMQLTAEDQIPHTFWIDYDGGSGATPDIDAGEPNSPVFDVAPIQYVFTADLAGTFTYWCGIHYPAMRGTWTTNGPPRATVRAPATGASWTGQVAHDVVFDVTDEGPLANVTMWLNYSYDSGSSRATIAGPIPAGPNPNAVSWTPARIQASDVVVNVTMRDGRGLFGYALSGPFEVDTTPPAITSTLPARGATNVPVNAQIRVAWSERMNESATGSGATFGIQRVIDGVWARGTVVWSANGTQMTFSPASRLAVLTEYEAHVNATAKDDSEPGNELTSPLAWRFTTSATADTTPPVLPAVGVAPVQPLVGDSATFTATVTDDGTLADVSVHIVGPSTDVNLTMSLQSDGGWSVTHRFPVSGSYSFTVWATDLAGNAASRTGSFEVRVRPEGINLLFIFVPLLLAATGFAAVLAMRRRRKERRQIRPPPRNV